ncbi:MAG: gamma-glutamylcyclotransferase family protein [Cyclobacteriaceae bacterium]
MNLHPENNLVFSYGTLKRGFPNYSTMMGARASYIADASTKFKYPLLLAGSWNAPFMIDCKNYPNSHKIKGELFEVDEKGILALDEFEGVNQGYYKRLKIEIAYTTEQEQIISKVAWCYFSYESSAELLADSSRFISFFGKEALKKYTPVHLRPADWRDR